MTANAIEGAFKYAETSGYGTVGMKVTVELEDMENKNQMNKKASTMDNIVHRDIPMMSRYLFFYNYLGTGLYAF